ncbi:MAG TPA: AlkA N-terminal domain-containing protein [Acidiferrobacter sp.]|nr:AlkA N-terminal domain-containing protein [Acidiferrobacter sp.]
MPTRLAVEDFIVHVQETEIVPSRPYDFAAALAFLQSSASAVLERIDGATYQRAWRRATGPELVTVTAVGSVSSPRLRIRVQGHNADEDALFAAVRAIRHIFSLDVDPRPFWALAETDPVVAGLVGKAIYARPVLVADPFESLVWAIIGQQVAVGFAQTLRRALLRLAGEYVTWDGLLFPLMPPPHKLITLDEEALRQQHFSRAKIRYLVTAAHAVASGELHFPSLAAMAPDAAMATLVRLPGIGRWTAESVLMRGLGVRTMWPAADLGLRRALSRAYALPVPLTELQTRDLARAWPGWEAWVAFFAWQSLQRP